MQSTTRFKPHLAGVVGLITLLVYLPALRNDFVNWDDNFYIFENPAIRSLDAAFFRWAFLGFHVSNWHPLTWMSHALDYAVWGLNPLGHHLMNIILHAINTALVVFLTWKLVEIVQERSVPREPASFLNKRTALSAAAAGLLFGVHPVHVESVAWVAERKDLLCGLFFLLSVIMYTRYAAGADRKAHRAGGIGQGAESGKTKTLISFALFTDRRYLAALALFVLALMSKPMAVSLPVVLLILDWYAFDRIRSFKTFWIRVAEKAPFFALSLAFSIIAILAQKSGNSLSPIDSIPLPVRIGVAAKSLLAYLGKILLPVNLIPMYPYPKAASLFSLEYLAALVVVTGITSACIIAAKKQPLWLSAWGYYVITLTPVLGILQVGEQAMADRYTYLPGMALFVLIGFGAASIRERVATSKKLLLILQTCSILLVFWLSYLTVAQTAVWRDSLALWNYIIRKQPDRVPIAYNNRGVLYEKQGRLDEAFADYSTAVDLDPGYASAYYNRGSFFEKMGKHDSAIADLNRALSLDPDNADSYYNRALIFENMGNLTMADADYGKAIALSPNDPDIYYRRGLLLQKNGQLGQAIADYSETIRIDPRHFWSYQNRAIAYTATGQYEQALEDFTAAIFLRPGDPAAYYNRGSFYLRTGKKMHAITDLEKACTLGSETACSVLRPLVQTANRK